MSHFDLPNIFCGTNDNYTTVHGCSFYICSLVSELGHWLESYPVLMFHPRWKCFFSRDKSSCRHYKHGWFTKGTHLTLTFYLFNLYYPKDSKLLCTIDIV
ncbi:tubby-like F-box protein 5 [Iris pallida]|uniref:Tubby-like F-box protein 5 n=1 Tax=Iris pallida TaxID=29817 RepID=A0AAX6H8Z4_IRIPA|nr:tubby-like F-box protein 5 [Iris pallida]